MDLRTVASKVVGQMANNAVPFSGPVAESLMQELLGAQDEQIVLLRGLSDDLNRLLDGPWQTARMYLKEAALLRRTPDQVAEALRSASAKLREAAPLQRPGSLLHAYVLVDLALVERLPRDDDLARTMPRTPTRQHEARWAPWLGTTTGGGSRTSRMGPPG